MANKRYDQFPAGTYTATDIILQADPSTGELEKIALSDIPGGTSNLVLSVSDLVNANNSGSNPEDISTVTIPANTLTTNGWYLEWQGYCTFNTASGTKTIEVRVAGVNFGGLSNTGSGVVRIKMTIIRTGSNTAMMELIATRGNAFFGSASGTNITFDFTASQAINVRITAGIANDILMWWSAAKCYSV